MLASWKKSYDQHRQHVKKQRHYFAKKVQLVNVMFFPITMNWCESQTIKKAEPRRIDEFELWCWRRLLRVPWTARDPTSLSQRKLVLNFIGMTDVEAETPILWSPDAKKWLIWKDPEAGKDWRREEKRMAEDECLDGITDWIYMSLSKFWELVMDR